MKKLKLGEMDLLTQIINLVMEESEFRYWSNVCEDLPAHHSFMLQLEINSSVAWASASPSDTQSEKKP